MRLADKREHYYYVCKKYGIQVIKSFNKKAMRKELHITDTDILTRTRHYEDAYHYAIAYAANNGYSERPEYVTLTGNDFID